MGKPSTQSQQISFDDDDDILSGLGLDNETPKTPPSKIPSFKPHQAAKGGTPQNAERPAPPTPAGLDDGEGEEETVQFGGYVPSMGDPSPNSASTARRRRGSNSFPFTMEPTAKKSVRFSGELESEEPKMRGGEEDKGIPQRTPRANRTGFAPSSGEDLEEISPPSQSSFPSHRPRATANDEFSNSLLLGPSEEPQTKGRRRESEEGKLEHPIFPWQKGAGSTVPTPSNTASSKASSTPPVVPSQEEGMAVSDTKEAKAPGHAMGRTFKWRKPARGQVVVDAKEETDVNKSGGKEPDGGLALPEMRDPVNGSGRREPERGQAVQELEKKVQELEKKVQELEKALEEAKAECTKLQVSPGGVEGVAEWVES